MGKEVSGTMRFCTTVGVAEKTEQSKEFKQFVHDSLSKHLSGDWGDINEEDAGINNMDPEYALSAHMLDGVKIWIKRDNDIITVLFPDEY